MIKTKEVIVIVVVAVIFTMVFVWQWGAFSKEDLKEKQEIKNVAGLKYVSKSKETIRKMVTDPETGTKYALGELILFPEKNVSFEQIKQLITSLDGELIDYMEYVEMYEIRFPGMQLPELEKTAQSLRKNSLVKSVGINRVVIPL